MKKSYITTFGLIILVVLLSSNVQKVSDQNGKTGATTSGCTCHSTISGSVSLSGIPTSVVKSSVNTFSLTYNAGSTKSVWGLDVRASNGTLAIGSSTGIKKSGVELTHSAPIASAGTSYTYANMQWTAPATAGTTTFTFACLAGNGDGTFNGDMYALGTFTTSVVLPVELVSFKATRVNKQANIYWKTAQEINSKYFEIEKSSNGKDFVSIQKIQAAGNSNIAKEYNYIDNLENANSIIYYRIKTVDVDGTYGYSPIQSINLKTENDILSIYPNPAKKGQPINVEINSEKDQTIDFVLTSLEGKIVSIKQKQINKGYNRIPVQYNNFISSGQYFIQTRINDNLSSPIKISIIE